MSNSKILKNSAFLYIRLTFTLGLGLITTRIVINALGVEDYGIYGVVAGLVTMFGFMNAAMSSSTQRYLSFDLGKHDEEQIQKTFTASVNIHLIIALVSLFVAEIVGVWTINNILDIPADRQQAANIAFQFSLIVFFFSIAQVPYHAALIAYEKMNAFACISIIEAVLKLGAACILFISPLDQLVLYSQLLACAALIVFLLYFSYVKFRFLNLTYRKYFDKSYYQELLAFSGWNLIGNIAFIARNQGINILINIFFGVTLNAAYAIALMMQGVLTQFATSIQQAINPQIIKSYAQNDRGRTEQLMHASSKYSFFVMLILVSPFYLNVDYVLEAWLGTVPKYSSQFINHVFVFLLIEVISNSLMIGLQATGKIRAYHITVGAIVLSNFPITWLAFLFFPAPELAFKIMILIGLVALFVRLLFVKLQMGYEVLRFLIRVLARVALVTCLFLVVLVFLKNINIANPMIKVITDTVVCSFSLVMIIYAVGMEYEERLYLKAMLRRSFINDSNQRYS